MEARVNVNELRIGNWVFSNIENANGAVGAILGSDEIALNVNNEIYHISEFQPIAITPEILEKCGFVRDIHYKDWYNYYHDNYCINFKVEGVPTSCYISVGFEDGE